MGKFEWAGLDYMRRVMVCLCYHLSNKDLLSMMSSIVRGMPYVTMRYPKGIPKDPEGRAILPTIWSDLQLQENPLVDQTRPLGCTTETTANVEREILLTFENDQTWLVFFSRPVKVYCREQGSFSLQIVDGGDKADPSLIIRVALASGVNGRTSKEGDDSASRSYQNLLREHADFYPGEQTGVSYDVNLEESTALLNFDWDVQNMGQGGSRANLIMFALPHHMDMIDSQSQFCSTSLVGEACIVQGSSWTMHEKLPQVRFRAPRPPAPEFVSELTNALQEDLAFVLPENYRRGAGDTYFSGKLLGRLSRTILIAHEINELCSAGKQQPQQNFGGYSSDDYSKACVESTIPTSLQIQDAVRELSAGVEIWITRAAETPFVYDSSWGGIVSCGCYYENDECSNRYPDCPALTDQGLNFGNGT
jgi:endoglucanase Acf2